MKIEKINENQFRCTLTKEELADREIKLSELAYGSEKARSLFRDMIQQANYEFGFEANDIPLMVEAIPMSGENIILQITKVEYPEELDTRFSKFSESDEEEDEESMEPSNLPKIQGADDVIGLFQKMQEKASKKKDEPKQDESAKEAKAESEEKDVVLPPKAAMVRMFEFADLESIESLAKVLGDFYSGKNDVYKEVKTARFFMFLRMSHHSPEEFNKVCNIVSEYGAQRKYSTAVEAYFKEHGTLILKNNALEILNSL